MRKNTISNMRPQPKVTYEGSGKAKVELSGEKIYNLTSQRAYTLYCRRGNRPGDALSDWIQAEKEIKRELLGLK